MLAFYLSMIESKEDQDKFKMLYEEYEGLMQYIAYDVLKDHQLAEDAVQTAFMNIIPHLHELDCENCHKIKGYMIVVVRNAANQIYNKRKKGNTVSWDSVEYDISDDENFEEEIFLQIEIDEIVDKIKLLNDNYRDILLLRYVHDLSDEKIAETLKINKANVRKRIERAKKAFKQLFNERSDDDV